MDSHTWDSYFGMQVSVCWFSVLLSFCCFSVRGVIQIDNSTLQYVDEYGRSRLFHGVNAVYKIPPWQPQLNTFDTYSSLVEEDMRNLQNWGFNVVRLGVMWPGVSVAENVYNVTYLDTMNQLITTLGSFGIYTIVDCHQDLFSRYFCGEGAPDWATPQHSTLQFPEPIRDPDTLVVDPITGYPNISSCEEFYFSGAVSNAFQDLYDNKNGLQDHFVSYWEQVASTFKDNEFVLGYELINEPWCGDYLEHPKSIFPKYADVNYLFPMYQTLNEAIRSIDDEHIIFYEAAVSDITPAGFTEGPGGPSYNDRQAYSYHVYCAPTDADGDPTRPEFCNITLDTTFKFKQDDRRKQGVAGFMTEFGALKGTGVGIDSLNYLLGLADSQLQSWSYWQYKYYADITTASADGAESFYVNGQLDANKVKALSRPYAPIIAGKLTVQSFDPTTSLLVVNFVINESATNSTNVIFVNEDLYYPNGYDVDYSSNVFPTIGAPRNFLSVRNIGTGTAVVQISPKRNKWI